MLRDRPGAGEGGGTVTTPAVSEFVQDHVMFYEPVFVDHPGIVLNRWSDLTDVGQTPYLEHEDGDDLLGLDIDMASLRANSNLYMEFHAAIHSQLGAQLPSWHRGWCPALPQALRSPHGDDDRPWGKLYLLPLPANGIGSGFVGIVACGNADWLRLLNEPIAGIALAAARETLR